jgi:hypothetical protein
VGDRDGVAATPVDCFSSPLPAGCRRCGARRPPTASSEGYQLDKYLTRFSSAQFVRIELRHFFERQDDVMQQRSDFSGVSPHRFDFAAAEACDRSVTDGAGGPARRTLPAVWRAGLTRALTDEVPPLDEPTRAMIGARLDADLVAIAFPPGLAILGRLPD